MRISLFIPCYVDQFYPHVGLAMADVLERLGHDVDYPEAQTCCGQPAFNCGYFAQARSVADYFLDVFSEAERSVVPSGSCAAMVRVFYRELFAGTGRAALAEAVGQRTFEFSQFLVDELGVTDVGAEFAARATFHDGCHGLRELKIKQSPRRLLAEVRGLQLVEMDQAESCCGFGGTFSVKFPEISVAMAEVKLASVRQTAVDYVISNDPSCLMQLQGYFDRQRARIQCLHLAEVLARGPSEPAAAVDRSRAGRSAGGTRDAAVGGER